MFSWCLGMIKPCMMIALNLELNFYLCQMQRKHIGKVQQTFCPQQTNAMYRYQRKQTNIRVVLFFPWTKVLFYTNRSGQYTYFLFYRPVKCELKLRLHKGMMIFRKDQAN